MIEPGTRNMNSDTIVEYAKRLRVLVREHEKWRQSRTLNLLASENFASDTTRGFLSSDLSNRYTARDHFYRGTRYADEIETLAGEIARKLFKAKYADIRPLSGHTCLMILFMSFLKPTNKVITCPPKYGGYPGSSELGLGRLLSLRNINFPYDPQKMNIIPTDTKSLVSKENPEMIVFGSSFIPFPYDIKKSIPASFAGIKAYDGSHVLGLIAGDEFQDPLAEGCNVLVGSTHKSFFGPQGGLIVSNDESVYSVIEEKIFPGIVDNIHLNRVASLAYAMLEMIKFGKKYAKQVILNSKVLAKSLYELKIPVKCSSIGFTQSHQVLLAYDEKRSVNVANLLEEIDIITDVGIRLGTSEVTRLGMRKSEMEEIAEIISDAIVRMEKKQKLRRRVHKLVSEFSDPEFTIN